MLWFKPLLAVSTTPNPHQHQKSSALPQLMKDTCNICEREGARQTLLRGRPQLGQYRAFGNMQHPGHTHSSATCMAQESRPELTRPQIMGQRTRNLRTLQNRKAKLTAPVNQHYGAKQSPDRIQRQKILSIPTMFSIG